MMAGAFLVSAMGGKTTAENVNNMIMKSAVSVTNSATLDLNQPTSIQNNMDIHGCNIEGVTVTQDAKYYATVKGSQTATFRNNVAATIAASSAQQASAINKTIFPNKGADASNTTNITQDINLAIGNAFTMDCGGALNASNVFTCDASSIKNSIFNQSILAKRTTDCVQNVGAVTAAQSAMTAHVNQSAAALSENSLSLGILIAALIAAIVFLGLVAYEGAEVGTALFQSSFFLLLPVGKLIYEPIL